MNLHQRDSNDEEHRDQTILHYWSYIRRPIDNPITAEEDTLTVVKLLLDKGADPMARDYEGFTPILLSAFNISGSKITNAVLNFFLEREEIGRLQKIDAMELAGAVIIHQCPRYDYIFTAFEYWHGALYLRLLETDGAGPIHKTPMKIGSTEEWVSSTELEHIFKDSSHCLIQSFLVRLRILSQLPGDNWDAIDIWLFFGFFHSDYNRIAYSEKFVEIMHLLWAMLESISHFDPDRDGLSAKTIMAVEKLVMVLTKLKKDDLKLEVLKTSLKLVLATDFDLDCADYFQSRFHPRSLVSFLKLFTMLADLPELLDEEIMGYLSKLVQRDRRDGRGRNLLLMARDLGDKKISHLLRAGRFEPYMVEGIKINYLPTVGLLIEAGSDDSNVGN